MSMMNFYIDGGLICSERDTRLVTTNVSSWWNFLPSFKSSTTLAKTLDLIVPYGGGRADYENISLVSSIAQASSPVPEDFIQMVPYMDPSQFFTKIMDYEDCESFWIRSTGNIWLTLSHPEIEGVEEISPLTRAVISRSLDRLKDAIKLCPESLLEKTQGLALLHLATCWPPGLAVLLQSEAKCLIDTPDDLARASDCQSILAWPFSYAAASQCARKSWPPAQSWL